MAGRDDGILVGCRCKSEDGFYGTVRFIGSIASTKGEWIGVEWDDPSRGKHSGEHEGVRYFTCSHPTAGSFVRRKKLDFGVSFMTALRQRYIPDKEDVDREEGAGDMVIQGITVEIINKKELIEEQSHLDELKTVSLRDHCISGGDTGTDILDTVPNIGQLNLSMNPLLASWTDIAGIARQLPKLEKLDVSENTQMVFQHDVGLLDAFKPLKALYLNKMKLRIEQLEKILPSIPNLEELYLCHNCISEFGAMDISLMKNIVVLFLDGNGISKWSEVMKLSSLPRLQTLVLNDNNLTEVDFKPCPEASQQPPFSTLKALSLYRNNIMSWSSLNEINILPSLTDLRFKENPVLEGDTPFNSRQLIIARVSKVTLLNGSEVTAIERQLAEKYYLRRYASWWISSNKAANKSRTEFEVEHPRYAHLVEVHGPPEEALLLTKKATALKDKLVSVTLRCVDCSDNRECTKKLPRDLTVQKLKGLIQRLFKIDFSDQVLSYVSQKNNDEYDLEDDLKEIAFYAVQSGDVILIHRS